MREAVQPRDGKGGTKGSAKTTWTNLDGMRGLGIILVILYHMGYRLVRHGWFCISIFFALSGFLITGVTVRGYEKTGRVDVVQFWSRRIGRLFPALFSIIILCALSRFVRIEDEAELWYERNDLLWACSFLTNYNLVFVRRDDYFAEFTKPSIVRHMWTLSIEEQYYIVWPVLFYAWTRFFPVVPKEVICKKIDNDEEMKGLVKNGDDQEEFDENERPDSHDNDGDDEKKEDFQIHDPMRPFLKALCAGECLVILVSYFSSWTTISRLGMSAAYFSTWSRMGDFACGGLVFLMVRLHPQIYRRIRLQPGLKPMTARQRVVLEFLFFLAVCLVVFPPMIQAPLDDVLHLYFYYYRIPFSFLWCTCTVAGVLQISEPLPRWAIFSRALNGKFLTTLGIISYGVYLNHWPIVLFFGAPIDHANFEKNQEQQGREVGIDSERWYPVRDATLLMFSLLFGFASFVCYEKPIMYRARKVQPWKVVACGLLGSAGTAGVVMACFRGIHDPAASDRSEVLSGSQLATSDDSIPSISAALFNDSLADGDSILESAEDSEDTRFTPIWLFLGWGHNSDATLVDILDQYTIPKNQIPCHGNSPRHNRQHRDNAFQCGQHATERVYKQLSDAHPKNSVIITCTSYSNLSPCDLGTWKNGTNWIWLSSPILCGKEGWGGNTSGMPQEKRCPEKLLVHSLVMGGVDMDKIQPKRGSFTGRLDDDLLYLMKLVLAVDRKIPGTINQHSVYQVQTFLKAEEAKKWAREQAISKDEMGWSDHLKLLVMGESIAQRMGGMFGELLESSLPCIDDKLNDLDFPRVDVINLAKRSTQSTNFFLPCDSIKRTNVTALWLNTCSEKAAKDRQQVLRSMPTVRPDVVILHDSHWASIYISHLRIEAMSNFLKHAISQGTKQVFFLTGSCTTATINRVQSELAALKEFLQAKRCSGKKSGIAFIVVAWHLLTCPTFDEGHCQSQAHGFHNILPDGGHPSGPSGEWLSAQALSVVLSQVAIDLPESFRYDTWDSAVENPVSSCLLATNNPDNDPPLRDLVQIHWVCP